LAAFSAERLDELRRHLTTAVTIDQLTRFDWRRQTDCVQQAFIVARLFVDCGPAAIFVDGHINDHVKIRALSDPRGVKAFFNRRFHDLGFKWRRVIVFDTYTTRKMGKRGSGRDRLHFHGVFELPRGWTRASLQTVLERVFGTASPMGKRQFHFSTARWGQDYTHNRVRMAGPLGKLAYVMAHAGATYLSLGLNAGKRSRSSPTSRGRYNRKARGLARGIPSNFNADIIFCDNVSKRAGKEAFNAWVKAEQFRRPPQTQPIVPESKTAPVSNRRASA
jgi:hypothetical protein